MALQYDFKDRVALVTGGSQGIGAGIAAAFVQAGAAVAITARTEERLEKTAFDLRNAGGRVLAVPADVTDEDAVREVVERCVEEFGRLDFAVNNATGGPMPAPLAETPSDGFSLGIRTNINGTFYGMKHEIPAMLNSGGGVIINMASVAGVGAVSNLAAYVSGKAGIIGLSRSAARLTWQRACCGCALRMPRSSLASLFRSMAARRQGPSCDRRTVLVSPWRSRRGATRL